MHTLEELKDDYINVLLNKYSFNIGKVANILDVNVSTIYRRLGKRKKPKTIDRFLMIKKTHKKKFRKATRKAKHIKPKSIKTSKLIIEKGKWIHIEKNKLSNNLRFAGCYAIFLTTNKRKLIYIGSSTNVLYRLKTYLQLKSISNKKYPHSSIDIVVRRNRTRFEHLTLEARLIIRLKPKYNKQFLNNLNKQEKQ